jgi:hypothetical protein
MADPESDRNDDRSAERNLDQGHGQVHLLEALAHEAIASNSTPATG